MRGHLPICPSSDASDDARNRLCRPSLSFASSVMCVYAPRAETSSDSCPCCPNRTRVWSNRLVPGVTYASTPMIGLMPFACARDQNSNAPNT
ncbi:Uncharacterised protein [Mycobacteroides abscessus]|nr:Uncharacterised protein [Mycobacteroides abscessus]